MLKLDELSYWEKKTFFDQIDFLIIGSGIVGCSTAFHLKKRFPDAKITVIERGFLPSGASTKNAGFACFGSVTELISDLKKMPHNEVWETVAKRWEGLYYLKSIIGEKNMDFQPLGSWDLIQQQDAEIYAESKNQLDFLNAEMLRITGVQTVFSEDKIAPKKFLFNHVETSFYNQLEGQIDSGKMMFKWHQILLENNIPILHGIEAIDIENFSDSVQVNTNIGPIRAANTAICVNGFAKQFLRNIDLSPARAQVLITKPIADLPFEGTFHFQSGYYYFRNINNRVLFGGGRNQDFIGETTTKIETTDFLINHLKHLLKEIILPQTPFEIDYSWAGIMGIGQTKKPIVELIHPRVGIGVRLGGMGVAIGSQVGQEVAELF